MSRPSRARRFWIALALILLMSVAYVLLFAGALILIHNYPLAILSIFCGFAFVGCAWGISKW